MQVVDVAQRNRDGFTLVEMIVIMVIIGILASLSFALVRAYQYSGEDSERQSDVNAIAHKFETYYNHSIGSNGATYPDTIDATNTANYATLFESSDFSYTLAPGKTSGTSIAAATNTGTSQTPDLNIYLYQPITSDGALCTDSTTNPCVRFTLYYRLRASGNIITVESVHQQ